MCICNYSNLVCEHPVHGPVVGVGLHVAHGEAEVPDGGVGHVLATPVREGGGVCVRE